MLVLTAALVVLAAVNLISLLSGTVTVTVKDLIQLIQGNASSGLVHQIVMNVRLPRIITANLVGMNLAVAGVLLQGILRNPIASPNIIGVNSGAGLTAIIIMTLFPGKIAYIPVAAFLGALGASLLIYALAYHSSMSSSTVHIVLAGIAVSSLLHAFSSGLMTLNVDALEITYSWLLGSLSGRSWTAVVTVLPYCIGAVFLSVFISPKLNLFALGDEIAGTVGLKMKFYRPLILVISSILAGSAVSVAGTIGFVGLIAPHSARLLIGAEHRYLVPMSALFGAILLVTADMVARTAFQPVEISVGVVTSVLGSPFFLFMLYHKGRSGARAGV